MDQQTAMLSIQATPDINSIRVAQLYGEEHTVLPCVALCEGVLWPANASAPELALAEEFGRFPEGWNGRPVVYNHPMVNDVAVSASSPEVLELNAFGQLFNTRLEDGKLKTEIWINNARVADMSDEAQAVIAGLQDGTGSGEVSTGLFTMTEQVTGEYDGQEFKGIWRNIVPDHLAVLPEGIRGACSVDDGCGAPRTNEMKPVMRAAQMHTDSTITTDATSTPCGCDDVTDEEKGFLQKVLESFRGLKTQDSTESETEVVQEPVDEPTTNIQENAMNEELVNGLIANERTQFTEEHREWLSSLDEAQLSLLVPAVNSSEEEDTTETTEEEETTTVETQTTVNAEKPVTTEAFVAGAPAEIREILSSGLKLHRARKDALVAGLKANARCKYSEADLKAKSVEELQILADLADVDVSYEGQGTVLSVNQEADDNAPPPAPVIFSTTESKE